MFDDPFERAEEERLTLQTSTSRQFFRLVKQLFEKRGRNGSPQSGKSNAVGAEDEQHP